jgi:hypothetical protein
LRSRPRSETDGRRDRVGAPIDVHASLVQDRLTERELLARVASGLFRVPSVIKANMPQPLRSRSKHSRRISLSQRTRGSPNELEAARAS